jgi:hypothetical protein
VIKNHPALRAPLQRGELLTFLFPSLEGWQAKPDGVVLADTPLLEFCQAQPDGVVLADTPLLEFCQAQPDGVVLTGCYGDQTGQDSLTKPARSGKLR